MERLCLSHATALEFWRCYRSSCDGGDARYFGANALPADAGFPDQDLPEAFAGGFTCTVGLLEHASDCAGFLQTLSEELLAPACKIDLLVERTRKRNRFGGVQLHSSRACFPRGSFYAISETCCVVSPELCLAQLAGVLDWADLVALIGEFCGYYVLPDAGEMVGRLPLTSKARLLRFADEAGRFADAARFKQAVECSIERSASPRETSLALLLCLPRSRGGYGLPRPKMNGVIKLNPRASKAFGSSAYCADLLWEKERVVVEYDGVLGHTGKEKISRDAGRRDALLAEGYCVFVVTNDQLLNRAVLNEIAAAVAKRLGVRLRMRAKGYVSKQLVLRRSLLK